MDSEERRNKEDPPSDDEATRSLVGGRRSRRRRHPEPVISMHPMAIPRQQEADEAILRAVVAMVRGRIEQGKGGKQCIQN